MAKLIFSLCVMILSTPLFASVKCDSDYIKGVQIKTNGDVIYTTQSGVRRLASGSSPVASQLMIQTLLLAVEKNLMVQVAYPDSFDCKATNTEVTAEWIYIQNPIGK